MERVESANMGKIVLICCNCLQTLHNIVMFVAAEIAGCHFWQMISYLNLQFSILQLMHVCIKQWYQMSGTKLDAFLQCVHDVCFSSLLRLLSRMVWVKEAHCEESPEITDSMVAISANSNCQVASIIS